MSEARGLWIDERQRELGGPWRKVHSDFQMDVPVARVGEGFDPGEFVETLQRAHVDSITVHAKNTYGYLFFPSATGPVHPDLAEPDLLGKQVAACRAAGIKVYAYLAYGWDEWLAERRPDLLAVKRDRTSFLPPVGEQPMWSALCISQPEVRERSLRHVDEVLDHCEPDGIWFDMVYPIRCECYCHRCLSELRAAGLDPLDIEVQRRHKNELHNDLVRALSTHVKSRRPDAQVDFNTQATLGLGERVEQIGNIDIEALPTGGWGYWYFPIHARYARGFGTTVFGMSARFHTAWGDYGGLKHPNQLRAEIAGIVALGVRPEIGDQPPPSARPDRATYETIGEVYADIARAQDYLEGAVPVSEAAIVVDGQPLSHLVSLSDPPEIFPSAHAPGIGGMAKLLSECQVQYDVVESEAEIERYRLLVLPDSLQVGDELAQRLNAYLESGGSVIAAGPAARVRDDATALWPAALAGTTVEPSPFQPAFMRLAGDLGVEMPRYSEYEFALYGEADRWALPEGSPAQVHGRLSEATFQRWQTGWQSAPPVVQTDRPTAVTAAGLAAFCFPLATAYYEHGYWFYRELFRRILERVLPRPLVSSSAPASSELTVTHQAPAEGRGARWLVHIVNYSPLRRAHGGIAGESGSVEYLEDPVPLRDVEVALAVDAPLVAAREVHTGAELELVRSEDRWRVRVPEVPISAIVAFEEER